MGMVCGYIQSNTPMNGQFATEWATSLEVHCSYVPVTMQLISIVVVN
jgi:hypothetical protein